MTQDSKHDFCCSGLTDARRQMTDHITDGPSHGVMHSQMMDMREDLLALRLSMERDIGRVTLRIDGIEAQLRDNQRKLYMVMGAFALLSSILTFLGPERIARVFSVQILSALGFL